MRGHSDVSFEKIGKIRFRFDLADIPGAVKPEI
jgi:hypothetical protein